MAIAVLISSTGTVSASVSAQTIKATTRPSVTVVLSDTAMKLPVSIPGGIVDVVLDASSSKTASHHLAFFRRNAGVDAKRMMAASDAEFAKLVTYQGGNTEVLAGKKQTVTMDLEPGNYTVADFGDNGPQATGDTTVGPATKAAPPAARGTITSGPGMAFTLPAGFDGSGVWRFTNADKASAHETAIIRLHTGKTAVDVVAWAKAGAGAPPFDVLGGFGPLGLGEQGWMDLGKRPAAGRYAVACFLPDDKGVMHAAMGMVREFTVA